MYCLEHCGSTGLNEALKKSIIFLKDSFNIQIASFQRILSKNRDVLAKFNLLAQFEDAVNISIQIKYDNNPKLFSSLLLS